jgi:uncharacterized protein
MPTGTLYLEIHLPGCSSLKEKRSRIKPMLARVGREFNVSICEYDRQDAWQEVTLAAASVSSDAGILRQILLQAAAFIERTWPDELIVSQRIEIY